MSSSTIPTQNTSVKIKEDNNNTNNKFTERQKARTFAAWYKNMIDKDRSNLTLYLSDEAYLEWFGRTIKGRKKVSAFLKHDMQCTRHDFTIIESIEKIQSRREQIQGKTDSEIIKSKRESFGKRKLRSNCNSPEWAEGCQPDEERIENKKIKTSHDYEVKREHLKRGNNEDLSEIHNQGDCILGRKVKRKCLTVTPPNKELGQGDCLPSTSTDSDKSHDALNVQLHRLAVECDGYIEFTRTRNNRSADAMKWERKCKIQISYSDDPLNIGEYIIWALRYTDESKCRRNLMSAFDEIAKEEGIK